ncbi:excisionase family DNA-binding protein [Ligilactobacillus acidipiscis]|uniref:excisionase family DNA-binding protein n=1 Tax=Ligilactobacillus acidipiscis TaxID=89059 RepID=UPI0023F9752B|nr:helix-turn-helix domain-containing protein [Ligilactobacillus acidipiscis]WEV56693.1 helix-turn-helix domain-containing protein [Ligilactobacillus acidipiscis]
MNDQLPRYMKLVEACKYLNVSYGSLYSLINDGLPVIKIGRSRRIDQKAADKWMESKTVNK